MKLCALLLHLAATYVAGDDAGASLTSRRALKELHLPAIVSETGKSEIVGKGTRRRDDDDHHHHGGVDETLSTGITKSLIRKTAVNNVVIVTWANNHYRDFARFWVSRLRALGKENFMVG